jgi:hypothetical protein
VPKVSGPRGKPDVAVGHPACGTPKDIIKWQTRQANNASSKTDLDWAEMQAGIPQCMPPPAL